MVVRCLGSQCQMTVSHSLRGAAASALVRLPVVQSAAYCLRLPLHMHRQLRICCRIQIEHLQRPVARCASSESAGANSGQAASIHIQAASSVPAFTSIKLLACAEMASPNRTRCTGSFSEQQGNRSSIFASSSPGPDHSPAGDRMSSNPRARNTRLVLFPSVPREHMAAVRTEKEAKSLESSMEWTPGAR